MSICAAYKRACNLTLSVFDSQFLNSMELLNSWKHFVRLIKFVIFPFEMCLWRRHLYFFENKQGIYTCVVSTFHSELEKMSSIWKIWYFYPGLKFHLGLAKQRWNFDTAYRVESFTCNCNVILNRSLLFSWDKIWTRYTKLKFRTRLKISK